jgi:hypothetical protein
MLAAESTSLLRIALFHDRSMSSTSLTLASFDCVISAMMTASGSERGAESHPTTSIRILSCLRELTRIIHNAVDAEAVKALPRESLNLSCRHHEFPMQGPSGSAAIHLDHARSHPITLLGRGQSFMKPATIVGILLIVLGIIGYATGGLTFTHQKKDVDVGPVQISHKTQDTLPLSPIFSTISLVAGVALVVVGARTK